MLGRTAVIRGNLKGNIEPPVFSLSPRQGWVTLKVGQANSHNALGEKVSQSKPLFSMPLHSHKFFVDGCLIDAACFAVSSYRLRQDRLEVIHILMMEKMNSGPAWLSRASCVTT